MHIQQLGDTSLQVSKICLGTMTWGEQNNQQDAFLQMDYAIDNGVNFFDTAELYPVPPSQNTYTSTESYIGNYFKDRQNREKIILASKISGVGVPWIRDGAGFVRKDILKTVENSLERLQTDYIDLYQLHWPQRTSPLWGQANYHESMYDDRAIDNMLETYEELAKIVKSGKIRYLGISNETSWGAMAYSRLSYEYNLPKIASIQNAYSLIRREFEQGLAEISMQENIGLLAYSPLAGGLLSGKYMDDKQPSNARFTLFPKYMQYYKNQRVQLALIEYSNLAKELGISLTSMSLAFVNNREFVTSNIIGATSIEQLKENIDSVNINLSKPTQRKINDIFIRFVNPSSF